MFEYLLFAIGLSALISVLFEVKNIITTLFANKDLSVDGRGSWALITACTDGIGQGFAVTLAKQGFNIIQVGRNPEKLAATGNDLKAKYGIDVRNVVKDFSLAPASPVDFYEDLFQKTKDLDISIVVNNVGAGSGRILFAETPLPKIINQMALNLFPISFISRLYLKKLMDRPQGAALINLSSIMAYVKRKGNTQYASCQAFDLVISEVTCAEVGGRKLDVLSVHPGHVDTPLTYGMKGKVLEINRYQCAEAALKCVGYTNRTNAHWKHTMLCALIRVILPFIPI